MVERFYRLIFSGNETTPRKFGQLYRSSDILLAVKLRLLSCLTNLLTYLRMDGVIWLFMSGPGASRVDVQLSL